MNTSGGTAKKKSHTAGKTMMGIQIAQTLDKTGGQFWDWVEEIENSDVFRKLHQSQKNKVIQINPILNYYVPGQHPDDNSLKPFAIRTIFKDHPSIFNTFINTGWNRFYYYFIEGNGTRAERDELARSHAQEADDIREQILEKLTLHRITIRDNSHFSSALADMGEIVAEVVSPDNRLHVSQVFPQFRYKIDEEKLYRLIENGELTRKEAGEFSGLRRKMESINYRFQLLENLINTIVIHQKDFLSTGEENNLKNMEEKIIAEKLEVDPSWISRLIKHKYIIVRNKLTSLKDLFISERDLNKMRGKKLLIQILDKQNRKIREKKLFRSYSDEEIRLQLLNEFNFEVSRRSINNWKREVEREMNHGTNLHVG
jgi:hypothetical protein